MTSRARKAAAPPRKSVDERTRTAYHEAGHAVLSAAIANTPQHVSIRSREHTLGRSGARMSARPTSRVQVHLAGFAAEHLLTGRRQRQLDQEVGFAILAHLDPKLGAAFAGSESRDGHRAVKEVLGMGVFAGTDEIKREVDRFYGICRESLSAVWPAGGDVAKALLELEELDRDGLEKALGDTDIHAPAFAVQAAPGRLPPAPPPAASGQHAAAATAKRARTRRPSKARAAGKRKTPKERKEWLLTGCIYGDDDGPEAPHYIVEAMTGDHGPPRWTFVGTDEQEGEVALAVLRRLLQVELPGVERVDPAIIDALRPVRRQPP